jgi:hypothetical protein
MDREGNIVTQKTDVAGTWENPARLPAVASDGQGTSIIVYEKHPARADGRVTIAVRRLGK